MMKQMTMHFENFYPQCQCIAISVDGFVGCIQANYFETLNSTDVTHWVVKFLYLQ